MVNQKAADVIIVGAGISGLTAAKILAENGIKTIVLERASDFSGKSFYSQIVSKEHLEKAFGKLNVKMERTLSEFRDYLLKEDSFVSVNSRNHNEKYCLVSKEAISNWMANQVKKSGADVSFRTVVRELITDEGKIIGVKTDKEKLFSDVVIVAEGVSPVLTKHAGLRKGDLTPDQVMLFVEEIITLPSEFIETRFNLVPNLGLVGKFSFDFASLNQMQGIGYIYTNKDSVSLGTGILLSDSISKEININQCQEKLKSHPAVSPFVSGGVINNYASYILPSCNKIETVHNNPLFSTNGCLVVGGAAMLVNPFSWEISTLSIISGEIAARTIIKAKQYNDFSNKMLSSYEKELNEIQEYRDLKNKKSVDGMTTNVLIKN